MNMTAPLNFNWSDTYSVGNVILDSQHRRLLALCSRASALMSDEKRAGKSEEFHEILHEMSQYSNEHFKTEEAILEKCGYPDLDDQIREHDEYREWLLSYLVSATEGRLDWQGMRALLVRWWVHHILESDMTYKPYMSDAE